MQSTTPFLQRHACVRLVALASPALLALSCAGGQTQAKTPHYAPAVGSWSRVVITLRGPLTRADQTRLDALKADTYRHLPLIHGLALRLPERNLGRLTTLPFIRHVSPDAGVTKCDEFTTGSSGATSAWQQSGVTGAGITVAVLDSGIKEHEDLNNSKQKGDEEDDSFNGSNILVHQDMTGAPPPSTEDDDAQPLYDLCGHGTHVAGIIAGNGRASTGKRFFHTFYGIASKASLVDVRVLDAHGRSDISTVIAGLQWVVANRSSYNIRVVNLSLGHPVGESYTTDPLCQAVEAAWKAGIVVVCAAGNGGRASGINTPGAANEGWGTAYGSIQSPGNDPRIITVGATKRALNPDGTTDTNRVDDKIATYSGRGPSRLDLVLKPDLIAPGNKVISLEASKDYLSASYDATNQVLLSSYLRTKQTAPSDKYFCLSGTSMASPVVAGAAALMLQASPSLSPDTVKVRLMLSADKWTTPGGAGDALTYGAGYLNIPAALASAAAATLPALSPTLTANSDGTLSLVMDRAAWGSTATTGSRATWGLWGTGVTDLRAAWGSSFVGGSTASTSADRAAWGSNSIASSRAAWGSSVWSDRAAWGSNTSAADLSAIAINGDAVTGHTHLLWNNTDGRVMLWSIAADGSFTLNGFGPYTDGASQNVWHATALATGPDGKSHLLWNNTDGRVMLWTVDDAGNFILAGYGPYTDNAPQNLWHAVAVSVGPDNVVHLLWSNTDHRAMLWSVNADFSFTLAGYGPYTDNAPQNLWTAKSLATGPDNITRILWANTDHRAMLWNVNADFSFALNGYGPYTDNAPQNLWDGVGVSVGPENMPHLLWNNTDRRAMFWNLDGGLNLSGLTGYGPYTDNAPQNLWGVTGLATGPDGTSHILWNNTDNRVMLWGVDNAGEFTVTGYGPYTDGAPQNLWSATAVSAGQ